MFIQRLSSIFAMTLLLGLSAGSSAQNFDIQLLAKPQLTEEGIHLELDQGHIALYGVNAPGAIWKAFGTAKKKQCLRIEAQPDFELSDGADAAKIKKVKKIACKKMNAH